MRVCCMRERVMLLMVKGMCREFGACARWMSVSGASGPAKSTVLLIRSFILKAKRVVAMEPKVVKLLAEVDEPEGASLRLILEDIKRTAEYASDIAEIVLNRTIERTCVCSVRCGRRICSDISLDTSMSSRPLRVRPFGKSSLHESRGEKYKYTQGDHDRKTEHYPRTRRVDGNFVR